MIGCLMLGFVTGIEVFFFFFFFSGDVGGRH